MCIFVGCQAGDVAHSALLTASRAIPFCIACAPCHSSVLFAENDPHLSHCMNRQEKGNVLSLLVHACLLEVASCLRALLASLRPSRPAAWPAESSIRAWAGKNDAAGHCSLQNLASEWTAVFQTASSQTSGCPRLAHALHMMLYW